MVVAVEMAGPSNNRCWCGSSGFEPAPRSDYLICRECGAAVFKPLLEDPEGTADKLANRLYSHVYWQSHQTAMGFPTIEERARLDLPNRCVYWLDYVLRYHRPPGRVLELGSAHGGFLGLLRLAGYDVLGMEMAAETLMKAKQWFAVDGVLGPIENCGQDLGHFDVIVLLDVLEHFFDPLASLRLAASHLTENGMMVVQTPEFHRQRAPDWAHFKPEHTFLFSKSGAERLFRVAGFPNMKFEPPIFPGNMFFFVSRAPLRRRAFEEAAEDLLATPDGRVALALLDSYHARAAAETDPVAYWGLRRLARYFLRALASWPRRRFGRRREHEEDEADLAPSNHVR
jgi:2-polyprenyl-3-methyl-5-hydroxy-6-metoxy-1,4-benzoquinol methylase